MDALVKRIQGVLRLLLVASVLLIWPLANDPPKVVDEGRAVLDVLGKIKDYWAVIQKTYSGNSSIQRYFRGLRSEDSPTSAEERRALVRAIPVAEILKVKTSLTERDLEEPRERFGHWEDPDSRKELESWISLLKNTIPNIEKSYVQSKLDEEATFADLEQSLRQTVRVPVINAVC